jgi:hypothetical protein
MWMVAAFVVGYLFSLWFLNVYYLGDAAHYTRFYNALYGLDLRHWGKMQRSYLGSAEPLYRYVVGLPAYLGIDRVHYISIWNGVLTGSIGYILARFRCSIVFSVLIFTNYYLFVLLGAAERLKFAYIMIVFSVCFGSHRIRYAFLLLAIFFHTQALVQLASAVCYYISKEFKGLLSNPIRLLSVFAVLGVVLGVTLYALFNELGDVLARKSEGYRSQSAGIEEILQWTLLLCAGAYLFKYRIPFILGMVPIGILTFLYGDRVNLAAFAFFVIMSISQMRTSHPIVLTVMGYMSIKSVGFIYNVVNYGTGYL